MTFTEKGSMTITAFRTSMPEWSGRIVVGGRRPRGRGRQSPEAGLTPLPEAALKAFPSVEEIVAKGVVRRE